MKWINVKNKLPEKGRFIAYDKNQNTYLLCYVDFHKNYCIIPTDDLEGHGKYPRFSHWSKLPKPPKED